MDMGTMMWTFYVLIVDTFAAGVLIIDDMRACMLT